ncbi:hypothetical protein Q7P37_006331 [Cladosporium fusiforme]
MAKRKASSPPASATQDQRSVRQRTDYNAIPSSLLNTKHRVLECVSIPRPSAEASTVSHVQQSRGSARYSTQPILPLYEQSPNIEGKRSRKPNPQRSVISDYFHKKARDDDEVADRPQRSSVVSPEEEEELLPHAEERSATNKKQDSVLESSRSSSQRPRRSAARRSYVVDSMDISDDDMPEPTSHRRGQTTKATTVESDFEEGSEEDQNDDEHSVSGDESESPSEASESDDGFGTDEGVQQSAKSKAKATTAKGPKAAKQLDASASRGTSKTGKKTGKSTASEMFNLKGRSKGDLRGLDTTLPPLSSINSIFKDITAKGLTLGLRQALETLPNPLRVATMCSGTESPLLALEMVQDHLKAAGALDLNVEHLFSAEIVPYKQAYIERNFHPPIIFRDITEMTTAAEDPVPMATTVYGAKVPVPGDVHILIAGTSCVDFSRLNKHRKDLDQENGGESSKTWFGVLSYVKAFRPAIVILENVLHGPWDQMKESYREIGYEVGGVLLDTKNYYLPQTRQRGYMVCFDKSKATNGGIEGAGEEWQMLMKGFTRFASSSVAEFMLPNEIIRTQQHVSLDDTTREYDWAACEIRHIQYRQGLRLGNARPLTFWSESGTMNVPENGILSWYRKQPERVRDYMDIALLRKAPLFDVRHKTRVWDVSQNVDMFTDGTSFGITPCITPSGLFFASDAGRALAPEELLGLQGLPLNKISFTTESAAEIQDLAGNAMSTTTVGPAIISALISGQAVLHKREIPPSEDATHLTLVSRSKISEAPAELVSEYGENQIEQPALVHLLTDATTSARRCLCESSVAIAQRPIQQCIDCGHTTCTTCGGNPVHNYQIASQLNRLRSSPVQFEQRLRHNLPQRLLLNVDIPTSETTANEGYLNAARQAFSSPLSFSSIKRSHQWRAIYQAPAARLELVLDSSRASWQLFALPGQNLPGNSELRKMLEQPVAVTDCHGSLLENHQWMWRAPSGQKHKVTVKGEGQRIASWLARIELPDYRDQQVWSRLHFDVPATLSDTLGYEIGGTYQALPNCGTSNDSLYKKLGGPGNEQIYLLKNPTRTGDPKTDSFVFSTEKERLDFADSSRPIIATIDPTWAPGEEGKAFSASSLTPSGDWQPLPSSTSLCPTDTGVEVYKPLSIDSSSLQLDCRQAELILRCDIVDDDSAQDEVPRDINASNDKFFEKHAYAFELMRRHLPTAEWRHLFLGSPSHSCLSCSPTKPGLRWMLDGGNIKPYEDPASAVTYERAIKHRPQPMIFQASRRSGRMTVAFGLNLPSLAHRAVARLPANVVPASLSWRLEQNMASASNFKFKPFTLSSTEVGSSAPVSEIGMSCELFPKQAVVLQWMKQQEEGTTFTIEEAEEAFIPSLMWRAEVRAQTDVNVRGGICADHPGFGKTITSLALIHSHLSTGRDIADDLRLRQTCEGTKGLIPTQATLIVAPHTLIKQWEAEIKDKLGYSKGVLIVKGWADLNRFTVESFKSAKIILVNRNVLGQSEYAERLANFVGMPGPATNSGRAFSQWLKHACKEIPEHLSVLQNEGLKALQARVKARYTQLIESDDFKAVVPSRRLVGKDYVESSKAKAKQAIKAAPKTIPTDSNHRPVFEMFYFNRIIIDEFHQYTPREYASLQALKADKRWGLSGTPALTDFYDIAQIAGLLGVRLRIGSDSSRVMAQRNVRALRKDMTDFEQFDAMREMPSDCMHARIHEIAQGFLDTFVRQNVMDFDEMTYDDHIVPVKLDVDHQAAYAELAQQLSSQEMNLRKAKSSKTTTRDKRFMAAIEGVQTAEEALSKDSTFFERPGDVQEGLQNILDAREVEVNATLKELKAACFAAQNDQLVHNESLEQLTNTLLEEKVLGDDETIRYVKDLIRSTARKAPLSAKQTKSKKKSTAAQDSDSENVTAKDSKEARANRELTATVNALAKGLLTSVRSRRYITNVQRIQEHSSKSEKCDSNACSAHSDDDPSMAVSALCGHRVCKACFARSKEQHNTKCVAEGCNASQQDHHLLWSHTLNDSSEASPYGAKLSAAVRLLDSIKAKGEKAILFVQYSEQLSQARTALDESDIEATIVSQQHTAGQQIADFRNNSDTVIVLNASDETAAGSNLQAANHVLFLSPLLRDNQYGYDSTMAQAVGRVRRHGQQKRIHVYRICALHTIDVDILQHRERRTTALTEPGAPAIKAPIAAIELDQNDPVKPERLQLVRENEVFSLRPKPWLYKCGVHDDEVEMAKAKGASQVAGWEDFSSQVKFSRAFAGNE